MLQTLAFNFSVLLLGIPKSGFDFSLRNPYYPLKNTSSPANKQYLIIKFYFKLILFRFFISCVLQVLDHH